MPDLTVTHEENGVQDYSYTLEIQGDNIEDRNPFTLNGSSDIEFYCYGFKLRSAGGFLISDPSKAPTISFLDSLMDMGCQIDGLPDDWAKAIEIRRFCAEYDIDEDEYQDYIDNPPEIGPDDVLIPDDRVY